MAPPRISPAKRLAERVRRDGECLIWTGARDRDGYGVIGIGRDSQYRAHRVAFELAHGAIPAGLFVCHACDVPACVNPAHLFLGTARDNTQDMLRKGRRDILSGERHPMRKLTDADVAVIRLRRARGDKLNAIARDFGISFQHVSALSRRVCRA